MTLRVVSKPTRLGTSWPTGPGSRVRGSAIRVDGIDGGFLRVVGTTKIEAGAVDLPVGRRVRLHEQISGRVVREMWSDPVTGAYAFEMLRAGIYYVVTLDHTGGYNGEVTTDVAPEPVP